MGSRQIVADIEEKLANQGEVLRTRGGISHIHISDFTEVASNCGLKRGTVCQIMRFISQFFLKLYIQFWKYFHSVILGSVSRDYCGKNRVLEFLAKIFG